MPKINAPRGTEDIYGQTAAKWNEVESRIRKVAARYHTEEYRSPVFEHTEVYDRGNDGSDVVNKEMYTFKDRGDRSLTLRPEGTAGLVRGYVQHKLYAIPGDYHKYFYIASNFRYERPQKGRMRIFNQFGVEVFGPSNPLVDVETILLGLDVLKEIGIHDYKLLVNTLGDQESQEMYKLALKAHFKDVLPDLCEDCNRRYEQNPLRMLDCKVDVKHESMISAPKNQDFLNETSAQYFDQFKKTLKDLNIEFEVDDKLVRGLDYYTHTVFEVVSTDKDAGTQSTIFGGGRYNHLVEYFEGPQTDAVGFGMGMERLMIAIENAGIELVAPDKIDVFGMPLSQDTKNQVFTLIQGLRDQGFIAEMDSIGKSMKAQWKMAERANASMVILLGEDEMSQGVVTIKNQKTQEQEQIPMEDLASWVEKWR